jgi:uncharacterized protein
MKAELPQELVEQFVLAAHGNLTKVMAMLEQEPALLNARWARSDESAIEAAAHTGNRAIAEHLLAAGAPLQICTAAMLGMVDQVAAFLESDPSLADAAGAHGIPVLYHAALSGRTAIGDLLLAHGGGAGIDSALHAAVKFGHVEMVRWLLAHGATNVDIRDFNNKTPLQVANELGHAEIAALLCRHNAADPNASQR